MIDVDKLLAPLAEHAPCGEDITYDQEFFDLDETLLGKAETQFSEAVKPDWKVALNSCLKLFERSKHLQVATDLCLASLQTDGLQGAADSLGLLSKLLSTYWDTLHPQLDPDDNLDPLERMNILSALTTPIGSYGDSFRFIERLHEAPLTNSPTLGKISHSQIHSEDFEQTDEPLEASQIEAAFRDTPMEDLQKTAAALQSAIDAVNEITSFLATVPGSDKAPDFNPLHEALKSILADVAPYSSEPEAGPGSEGGEAGSLTAGSAAGARPNSASTGPLQNRAQVVETLDRLCDYYKNHEPSSPVPLLLQRAKRLVHSGFLEIMADLAPDSETQIRTVTGTTQSETKEKS